MNQTAINLLKRTLPAQTYSDAREFVLYSRFTKRVRSFGTAYFCPVCRSSIRGFLPFGLEHRPNAKCPVCGSLERHRLVYIYLQQKTDLFLSPVKKMLHVAPENCLAQIFKESRTIRYFSADIAPYAMAQMDLTRSIFTDNAFDVIFLCHVFPEVEDDEKAMHEVYRMLKPGGWAILQAPIVRTQTFEDPSAVGSNARIRAYGHPDVVRAYGLDYFDRLEKAGFRVHREKLSVQSDIVRAARFGISPATEVAYCVKPSTQ